jgi:hypothetical protein
MPPLLAHKREPIVISFTEFANFKRCRKLFDFSYRRRLAPLADPNAVMQVGSDIHAYLAACAMDDRTPLIAPELRDVVEAYLAYKPLPFEVISAEQSLYTLVLPETDMRPALYIRTTLDLIYPRGTRTIVGRDYKTFTQKPSWDTDLDFQGRIYTCCLMRHYPQHMVEFEWHYIRQELGRELKGKGHVAWTNEERYWLPTPMVLSDIEAQTTWRELEQTAYDLVRAIDEDALYRVDLKVGPHSCDNCYLKVPCKAEYTHGELSAADQALFTTTKSLADHTSGQAILDDPRVMTKTSFGIPLEKAIEQIYGSDGVDLALEEWKKRHA